MRRDNDDTRKMYSPFGMALLCTLLFWVVIALSGCSSDSGKVLESITIQPADNKLAIGKTQKFTVVCSYSDGTTSSDLPVTWSSSSAAVATISSSGIVTAVAAGQTTITASLEGYSGSTTLTVPATKLVSIAITPSDPTPAIAIDTSQQFTATGAYSDGTFQDLTSLVLWTSSDTSKATISQDGKATAVAAGSALITATSGSISGTATLSVSPASVTLQSIVVTAPNTAVLVGTSQQFTATGTFSNNSTQDLTSQVTWSSSDTSLATIDQNGRAGAAGPGSVQITATSGGVSGTMTLTVAPLTVTLQSIAVTPANATVAAGASQQFVATGTFSNGTTQDLTNQVAWSSSSDAIATISQGGTASAVAAGTATIRAESGGVSGSRDLVVTPASAAGTWVGTYFIYESVNPDEVNKTYTFRFDLTQSGTKVTGASSLRYNDSGQLRADGQFDEAVVTGSSVDFTFSYIDPRFSHKMINIGTATINGTSMTGDVIENYNGGFNCSYVFNLKKQ